MEIERTKERKVTGTRGLYNFGNMCFLNTCLQILSHTDILNTVLTQANIPKHMTEKTLLLNEWNQLRKLLWKPIRGNEIIVNPTRFVHTVKYIAQKQHVDAFAGDEQNDVSEFFTFLIEQFHTALSRKVIFNISGTPANDTDHLAITCFRMAKDRYENDYSEIWNLFYGTHVSILERADTGARVSQLPEPYNAIHLPLPMPETNKTPTLLQCFDCYTNGETIDDFKLDDGTITAVRRRIAFWTLPTILTIVLKRFTTHFKKTKVPVSVPLDNLDLSPYVVGYKPESYVYELYGVANHHGSLLGGHYTAHVKHALSNEWYLFNDTDVSRTDHMDPTTAYVLFYRKKTG